MVLEALLSRGSMLLAGLAVLLILAITVHGLTIRTRSIRHRRATVEAFHLLIRCLDDEAPPDDMVDRLRALPLRRRITLFWQAGRSLDAAPDSRLHRLAARVGLHAHAESLCRHRAWWRRLYGVRLFIRLGGGHDIVPARLDDVHPAVRQAAVEWTGAHGHAKTIGSLTNLVYDKDPATQHAVHDALLRFGPALVPEIVRHLRERPSHQVLPFLRLAVRSADIDMIRPVLRHAEEGPVAVRVAAVELLGLLGGPMAHEGLVQRIHDEASDVRATALLALARMRQPGDAALIAPALSDPDPSVVKAAALGLARLGPPGLVILRDESHGPDTLAGRLAHHALRASATTPPHEKVTL